LFICVWFNIYEENLRKQSIIVALFIAPKETSERNHYLSWQSSIEFGLLDKHLLDTLRAISEVPFSVTQL